MFIMKVNKKAVCILLNELADEIKQLKEENKQLKQDKRRLVNYISKTFNLSDKAIQQLIIEDEFNDVK